MSENQSTKLKINYDVNCQSKVVDEDKGVRVSPIEWTKAEQNVKNMRAFVDYIGDKHAKLRTVVCDTVERAESLLDWANHHIQCLIIIKMDDNDRKKLETKFTASIEIHSFHEVIVSCTTKTKFFVQTWMAVAVYATLDEGENYNQEVKEPNPNDLFLVCYTSGSTGLPKGVTYTHSTFLQGMSIAYRSLALMEISTDCHAHVSFLPMAHIMEQIFMLNEPGSQAYQVILHLFRQSICLRLGARIAFLTNDTSGLMEDYAYYRPTLICTVPRVLSRLYTEVMRVVNTNKIKAQLFQLAVGVKTAEQSRGVFRRDGLLDYLFFRGIRNRFGGRVRGLVCGSAPLQPEVLRLARAIFACPMPINIRSTYFLGFRTQLVEAYGSTEVGGLATVSLPLDTTGGHAGSVAPEVYIKLIDVPSMGFVVRRDAVGEICVKSPAVTPGYFKDEEQTRGLFDKDGYVRMGDIGRWTDRGTLQIVDRVKNIFKLSQGEYVAPEKVEQIYALSPLVTNVYVEGNALYPYAVGVVVPNLQEIERQFPQQLPSDGVQHTESEKSREKTSVPLLDLNQEKNLTKLLIDELNRIGSAGGLKGFEQIRAVHLSDEPFSVANGLLTPTMKIARPQLRQKFAHHIQALYDAGDS
ncbi:AMP-binding enzyme [Opisthorchis viverrini]|uniref:long-chain-fatty-acid--CoA ligase n=1 Tax=Opisthorchis viverrini TaxID=6198 RepID=A0A1S8X943_OPIVI|nr:AMP-binding enzyme [Opisthorchis viverrini]